MNPSEPSARVTNPSPPAVGHVEILTKAVGRVKICRLFHRSKTRLLENAILSLRNALQHVEEVQAEHLLIAGAGFVTVTRHEPTLERLPDPEELKSIAEMAQDVAEAVRESLADVHPVIVFGIDVYASCKLSGTLQPVGQFACVLSNKNHRPMLFPKRFPLSIEEDFLHLAEDAPQPILMTPVGLAAVMICNDINLYHPVGSSPNAESQRDWRTSLREDIRTFGPWVGLHLAHDIDSTQTLHGPYSIWRAELGVPLLSVGRLPTNCSQETASSLAKSLSIGAEHLPILDLCESHP